MTKKQKLPLGKLPIDVLGTILSLAPRRKNVIVGPGIGIDSAILLSDDKYIVSACDPITGTTDNIGWLSVHVNANDVLSSGGEPLWYIATLLLPVGTCEEEILNIMRDIAQGLNEINASLVAGHTEITDKVRETIISGTMIGAPIIKGKYITNTNARPGDRIIMTKGAGIEGTWILASNFRDTLEISDTTFDKIMKLRFLISVYNDVHTILKVGIENIHAMHDATEGGLLGAIYEISIASDVGFEIYRDQIILLEETISISKFFGIDPIELISSGTLVVVVDKDHSEDAIRLLRKAGIMASEIGYMRPDKKRVVVEDNKRRYIDRPPIDALWRIYDKVKTS